MIREFELFLEQWTNANMMFANKSGNGGYQSTDKPEALQSPLKRKPAKKASRKPRNRK